MSDADYIRSIEQGRAKERESLLEFPSVLDAVERREVPVGETVRLHGVTIAATPDGFLIDGQPSGPRSVDAGRYALRLSHQGYPAVVVQDREATRVKAELRWWPVDPALRVRGRIEPDAAQFAMRSTASPARAAERAGWLTFSVGGEKVRLALTRLLEPGVPDDHLDVFFRDGTTGQGSYEVGRYVPVERAGDEVIVDFNLAYNPACSLSPYYNCPIPPPENHTAVPIRAGEMTPLVDRGHG